MTDDVKKALEALDALRGVTEALEASLRGDEAVGLPEFPAMSMTDPDIVLSDCLAHIDGEDARTAAAVAAGREEQREACADWLDDTVWPEAAYAVVRECRATPLTATPLADELRDEREVSQSLREQLIAAEAERDAWKEHAGKVEAEMVRHKAARDQILLGVEAERDEWRRQLRDTERYSAEQEMAHADLTAELAMVRAAGQELTMEFEGVEAERDALRAQVAEAAERLDEFGSQPTLADGIQAMRLRLVELRAQVEAARAVCAYNSETLARDILVAMDGAKP